MVNLVKLWLASNASNRQRGGGGGGGGRTQRRWAEVEDPDDKTRSRTWCSTDTRMRLLAAFLVLIAFALCLSLLWVLISARLRESVADRQRRHSDIPPLYSHSGAPLFLHNWDAVAFGRPGRLPAIVVCSPLWTGARPSAETLGFPVVLRGSASGDEWDAALLEVVRAWKVPTVALWGLPEGLQGLAKRLSGDGLHVAAAYFGGFGSQHSNEANPSSRGELAELLDALEEGSVASAGLARQELLGVARELGMARAQAVVGGLAARADALQGVKFGALDRRLHIGVLGGATLGHGVLAHMAAACTMPDAVIHVLRLQMGLPWLKHCRARVLQHAPREGPALHRLASQMDLNLHLSAHQCQPDLPMASVAAGVPCLVADSSSLYAGSAELTQLLVCPQHASVDALQRCISAVLSRLSPRAEGLSLAALLHHHLGVINARAVSDISSLLQLDTFMLFGHRTDLQLTWSFPSSPEEPRILIPLPEAAGAAGAAGAVADQPSISEEQPCATSSFRRPRTLVMVLPAAALLEPASLILQLAAALSHGSVRVLLLSDLPRAAATTYLQRAREEHRLAEGGVELVVVDELVADFRPLPESPCHQALRWALAVEQLHQTKPFEAVEFPETGGAASVLLARRHAGKSSLPQQVAVTVRLYGSLELQWMASGEETRREHFSDQFERVPLMERFAMSAADVVLTPSMPAALWYQQHCQVQWRAVKLAVPPVMNRVSGLSLSPHPCQHSIAQRRLASSTTRFLVPGPISELTHSLPILRAAVSLLLTFPNDGATFAFCGVEGPEGQALLAEMKALIPDRLSDRFSFGVAISPQHMEEAVCGFDVAIVASVFEPFDMVVHELSYLGLPLVVSNSPAHVPFFTDQSAFFFELPSLDSLRAAMHRAITDTRSVTVPSLKYPDPTIAYDCLLRAPASANNNPNWWHSPSSGAARQLLSAMSCQIIEDVVESLQQA